MKDSLTFHLGSFSGPLEFLIALVQSQELNVEDIPLKQMMIQFLEDRLNSTDLDVGAEFVGSASLLIWLKSKLLLPQHEQPSNPEGEQDPRFEIIHHLLDYCRFRDAAKSLSEREQKQSHFYYRGVDDPPEQKKPLGIEHLSLDDFASLFKQLIAKSSPQRGTIQEDEWKVSDKIATVKKLLKEQKSILFTVLFSHALCREELIVFFLAILELMKQGDIAIIRSTTTNEILITGKENDEFIPDNKPL